MKWRNRRGSANIEDRRGGRGGVKAAGGGLGLGAVALLLASVFFPDAVPFLKMVGVGDSQPAQSGYAPGKTGVPQDEVGQFISVVLADTEEVWNGIFSRAGERYTPPTLVLFSGRTSSPCGPATAGSGPFYCPGDKKIYIDPAFYGVMERKLGASGDFAQAYVVAHEVAHHVQNEMGVIPEVDAYRKRSSKLEANKATVRLELQADCYSGVWSRHLAEANMLEKGDIEEALNAAFQIGDDTLQSRSGGHVNPATFTHGSSQQRVNWFYKGLETGDINQCDTFSQGYEEL